MGALFGVLVGLWLERKREPQLEIVSIENNNPCISFAPPHPYAGECWKFYCVFVSNKPFCKPIHKLMPRKPAINCTAVIEFFEFKNNKRRIFQPILGRWSSTKELYPMTVNNQYELQHKIYHSDPVTISTNDKEELAII
ncbi:MAG: hypothetical protein M1491_00485 [Deltaproteobacteria bacterium]|nr:hypothetical protein [Deltaproteobacteria bacterium]MCL5278267.1 hypothetical protein [Deltaproteobacteria bacterium]